MDKKIIEELKKKLLEEKASAEEQLKKFATKDKNLPGDWDTRFPQMDAGNTGHANLETAADEVEEYSNLLPMEYNLELKLRETNLALKRIENGTYGICENCKKQIPIERLRVSPEARVCLDCEKK